MAPVSGTNPHRCINYEAHTRNYEHYTGNDPMECAWDGSCITPHADGYRGWYTAWSFDNSIVDETDTINNWCSGLTIQSDCDSNQFCVWDNGTCGITTNTNNNKPKVSYAKKNII